MLKLEQEGGPQAGREFFLAFEQAAHKELLIGQLHNFELLRVSSLIDRGSAVMHVPMYRAERCDYVQDVSNDIVIGHDRNLPGRL